jgi:hypothetical protein
LAAQQVLIAGQSHQAECPQDSLIDAAAECIRARAEEAFAELDPPVKLSTKLRNPWEATIEQRAAAARTSRDGGSF